MLANGCLLYVPFRLVLFGLWCMLYFPQGLEKLNLKNLISYGNQKKVTPTGTMMVLLELKITKYKSKRKKMLF